MEQNALRSWHATMYKFVTSMVLCFKVGIFFCDLFPDVSKLSTYFAMLCYAMLCYAML